MSLRRPAPDFTVRLDNGTELPRCQDHASQDVLTNMYSAVLQHSMHSTAAVPAAQCGTAIACPFSEVWLDAHYGDRKSRSTANHANTHGRMDEWTSRQ